MSQQRFPCRDQEGHDKRSGVASFMLQQFWPWQGFLFRDRAFQVETEFGQGLEFLSHNKVFMCHDRVLPWARILCYDKVFLCRDRVWSRLGVSMS